MKLLKPLLWLTIILLTSLTILLIISSGLALIGIIGTGILLLYNAAILFTLKKFQKHQPNNKKLLYLLWLLFLIPIFWGIIDFEGLFNFLLQGVSLDMK